MKYSDLDFVEVGKLVKLGEHQLERSNCTAHSRWQIKATHLNSKCNVSAFYWAIVKLQFSNDLLGRKELGTCRLPVVEQQSVKQIRCSTPCIQGNSSKRCQNNFGDVLPVNIQLLKISYLGEIGSRFFDSKISKLLIFKAQTFEVWGQHPFNSQSVGSRIQFHSMAVSTFLSAFSKRHDSNRDRCSENRKPTSDERLEIINEVSPVIPPDAIRKGRRLKAQHWNHQKSDSSHGDYDRCSYSQFTKNRHCSSNSRVRERLLATGIKISTLNLNQTATITKAAITGLLWLSLQSGETAQ